MPSEILGPIALEMLAVLRDIQEQAYDVSDGILDRINTVVEKATPKGPNPPFG